MRVRKMFRWEAAVVLAGLSALQAGAQTPAQTGAQTAIETAAPQAAPASAPAGTRVHGTITDPDGELIPGATVSFTPSKGGGAGKSVKSGSDGTYAITLPAGGYTYVVSMTGFASYSTLNLKIPVVATGLTLDAKLQVGVATQVVNVDANSVQLSVDPDANASSTVLSGKDLDALSDDPDELSSELTALAGPSAGPNGGQIYVDGFTGGQLPPKSSIREIRINQNPFSAQYDKLGYGRVEIFTKPGTDKLHGSLQVNGNPSQLNSENPLINVPQSPYHTLFLFGTVTGPINRFASYSVGGSHRDIQDNEFTNAQILELPGTTTLCPPGQANCVYNSSFQQSTHYPQSRTDFTPKIDLALGSKNVLSTRYQFVTNTATNASIGNLQLASNGQNTSSLSNELQVSDTQTYSSRLINETRFEYEREHVSNTAISNAPTVSVSGAFTGGGDSAQNLSDHQDHFEVQNYTSLQLKKNFLRFGGRFRSTREAQNTTAGTNGQFIYSSLLTPTCPAANPGCVLAADNSYQSGNASQFGLTIINQPRIDFTFADLGLYLETDWKARQNLSISYGIRYETQNHEPDHHDFAPRASFAYGIGKGTPKTVVRGGLGLFYDRFSQGNILTLDRENGVNETILTIQNPTCTTVATCKLQQATPQAQTVYSMANNLRSPYILQFALGVDQQLGRTAKISITGLHSQGIHQLVTQNVGYNAATRTSNGVNYQYFTEGAFQQTQLNMNGSVQTGKRLSLFGYVSLNSAHGDTSGAGSFLSTPGNLRADYGRTTFDVTARYFMAGSITLPHFIQLSPFLIGQSGNPYNVTSGLDSNGDTIFNDRPYAVSASTATAANVSTVKTIAGCGTFALPGSQTSGAAIAPLNACTGPALFTLNLRVTKTFGFGNKNGTAQTAGQGGGGRSGAAMGMGGAPGGGGGRGGPGGGPGGPPSTSTGKKYNLQVGAQFQNLFANTDYATPIAVLSSARFGQSTQVTGGPYTSDSALRRIQLTASFSF